MGEHGNCGTACKRDVLQGFVRPLGNQLVNVRKSLSIGERGAWIGARSVQVLGDTEGLPTRAQLEAAKL